MIKSECDQQDSVSLNGIPSYQDAWTCNNKIVIELNRLIQLNHDDILMEVNSIIENHTNSDVQIDSSIVHKDWLKDESKWRPIWVRFMNEWSKTADNIPTLKRIASLFPEICTLHVSIFYPGTTVIEHRSPSRAFHRYHYGLKVSDADIGLNISGYDVKWKEHEGFLWDDTLPHSAWNHTSQPRIVIFADVFREFSNINAVGSKIIYSLLQRTKHVAHVKTILQREGITILL